ncbi:MAG: replicative DNA helicase [Chitinophagaceae bacterium]
MPLPNLKKEVVIRRKSIDLSSMMYGKIPPQAKDLEEAVLGAILLEKAAFDTVIEILKSECFYVEAHQVIFEAMRKLSEKSMPVDILTVVEELKFMGELEKVGGPYYITRLTNAVVSSANIEAHARIVLQKFIQRELIRISGENIRDAYDETIDVFKLLDGAETKLFEITDKHLRQNFQELSTVLVQTLRRIEDMRNKHEDITGVTSGYKSMDRVTYGWQKTDLIILAARPSVGKTAFALNLARNAALALRNPTPVALFSLEMSSSQIVQRILSAETEISMEKISRGKLEDYEFVQLNKGVSKLASAPIFIDDTAALNIFELRAKCRRLKGKYNIGMIIIDYLQLMSGGGDNNRNANREQEISKISRDLKSLAKELEIPILALSQLSRDVEKRKEGNKMPQLSDLRESGAIEQDADMVMFIYRPEYYDLIENEHGDSVKGETHIRIAKHRNGSLETIKLTALLHIQKFVEMENAASHSENAFAGFHQNTSSHDGPKLFIQKESRMNDMDFPEDGGNPPF